MGSSPVHLMGYSKGPRFQCIIRTFGTTGPEAVLTNFFCNTKEEGKVLLAQALASLKDPSPEVQIFDQWA